MKNRFGKFFFLLVCAAILCAMLGVSALADGSADCTHEFAKIERPSGVTYPATCVEPGGYIIEVRCEKCNAYLYEYKQADAKKYPIDQAAHKYKKVTVSGECAEGTVVQEICTLCGDTKTDTNSGNHDWVSKRYDASTCNEESYTYEECSKCKMTRNHKAITTAVTHTYTKNQYTTTREPTCGVAGEKTQQCDCGEKTRTLSIAATGNHSFGATQTKAGDCSRNIPEKTYQVCSACGYEKVLSQSVVHSLITEDTPASCTSAGTHVIKCGAPGCTYVQRSLPIPALGHSTAWKEDPADSSKHQAVCTRCGAVTASGSHTPNKKNPLCTDRVNCSVCFAEMKASTKHAASVAVNSGDDTNHDMACPTCGYVTSRVRHSYSYVGSDCTNKRLCSACGHTANGNSSHTLSNTWTSVGNGHARKCTVSGCSYQVTEEHAWGDWFVAYEPTTTSAGTEAVRCTKCNAIMTRAIPKLTATATPEPAVTPDDTPVATSTPDVSVSDSVETTAPGYSDADNVTTDAPDRIDPDVVTTDAPVDPDADSAPTSASNPGSTATSAPTASGSVSAPTSAPSASNSGSTTTNAPAASGSVSAPTSAPAGTNAGSETPTTPVVPGANSVPTSEPATSSPVGIQTDAPETSTDAPTETATIAPPEGDADADPTLALIASANGIPAIDNHAPATCADLGRECVWEEFVQRSLLVRVCALCGNVSVSDATGVGPVFLPVDGVTVIGAPASDSLILRAAALSGEPDAVDAFAAISVAWALNSESVQHENTIQVSLPLFIGDAGEGMLTVPSAEFRLVRADVSEDEAHEQEWTEIEFTFENGILTFEMERPGIYLLIPA